MRRSVIQLEESYIWRTTGYDLRRLTFLLCINDLPSKLQCTVRPFSDDCLLYAVLRWYYTGRLQRRFSAQHRVATLEQCCHHSKQCRKNAVMLWCTKNRRCESSRVTSPLVNPTSDAQLLQGDLFKPKEQQNLWQMQFNPKNVPLYASSWGKISH